MAKLYRAEPFVKVVPRSRVPIRAPRAAPRRMSLVLLLGLGVFWIPFLIGGEYGLALAIAALPLVFFFSTFRGANTLRLDSRKEKLTVRRHFLGWSIVVGEAPFADIEGISVDRRFERRQEESPLMAVSVVLATVGIHAHFGGRFVQVPVWDLVVSLRTTEVLVVITSEEQDSVEVARKLLAERLNLPPAA